MTRVDESVLVSLDDIRLAAGRIRSLVRRTPLLEVEAGLQARLYLKCECFQPGGAFKIRGATNKIQSLTPADVNASSAKLVHPDALTWVVVGDLAKIEAKVRALNLGEVTVIGTDGKPAR